jgi:hypothetical protein
VNIPTLYSFCRDCCSTLEFIYSLCSPSLPIVICNYLNKEISEWDPDAAFCHMKQKRKRSKNQAAEAGKENDDEEDAGPAGSKDASTGEEGDEESEANDHSVSDDEPPVKKKSTYVNQVKKETGSNAKEKDASRKRVSTKPAKVASKPSQDIKDEPDIEVKKAGRRAKSSKESDAPQDSNKVNKVSKSKKDDGKESQNNKVAKPSSKNKGIRSITLITCSVLTYLFSGHTSAFLIFFTTIYMASMIMFFEMPYNLLD